MPAKASARYVRISPSKVRQVANLVRGLNANEALDLLKHLNKGAALPVRRVIQSAVANAAHLADEDHPVDVDELFISGIRADAGPTLKRIRPRAQGRAHRIRKRTSHIHVELEQRGD
ncbi:MAG: 50S ribosomal protein L22 [Candidatus Krumholzibacteriota bacterium]|nr:50S ribosomal protein L22 [Candidatus Krumholzibacteriota bacterium]